MNSNLILNPWRSGFILIFISNIIFHLSPAFLLLFILFAIFVYVYIFLFYIFNDYAAEYSREVSDSKESSLIHSISRLTFMKEGVCLLKVLFGLFVHFLTFWSVRILAYICVKYSNEKTYFVLLIEEYFSWKVKKHLW